MIYFQVAKITSDVGFLLVREIDERFRIIDPIQDCLEDLMSSNHKNHSLVQKIFQRLYQIVDCYNDAHT